jgi:hypothetical protein
LSSDTQHPFRLEAGILVHLAVWLTHAGTLGASGNLVEDRTEGSRQNTNMGCSPWFYPARDDSFAFSGRCEPCTGTCVPPI